MIPLGQMTRHAGEWLRGQGPHNEIVISSRVRLARNLAGFPFVGRSTRRLRAVYLQRTNDKIGYDGTVCGRRIINKTFIR